jgi:NADPH:quinone reductase-like Zn-dependent oxidoreductase
VGSAAIQIARNILQIPVVIATASRPETMESCRKMGATHVVNHREDLEAQIKALNLDVPIRYVPFSLTVVFFTLKKIILIITGMSTWLQGRSNISTPWAKSVPLLPKFAQLCKPNSISMGLNSCRSR